MAIRFSNYDEIYPRFVYLIPVEGDDNDQTTIQGFSRGMYGASMLLRYLRDAPASIFDLLVDTHARRVELACQRASYFHVIALNTRHLPLLEFDWSTTLVIALSWQTSDAAVQTWIEQSAAKALHASNTATGDHVVALDELNDQAVRKFVQSSLERLREDARVSAAAQKLQGALQLSRSPSLPRRPLDFPARSHNTVVPNEFALHRAGYSLTPLVRFDPTNGDAPVIDAISKSARALLAARGAVDDGLLETPALILTAPGRSRALCERVLERRDKNTSKERAEVAKSFRQSWGWLKRQAGYFPTFDPSEEEAAFATSAAGQILLRERTEELFTYTQALQVRAASEMSAVLRMPGVVQQLWQPMVDLAKCHAGNSQRRREKLAKLMRALTSKLTETVPPAFVELLERPPTGVRIVADLPLEWLPLKNGQPLMLRHCCSRIPCSPGNLMFQVTLPRPSVEIPQTHFQELLIVRSFESGDQLTELLVQAIDGFALQRKGLKLTIRDVKSKEEFCNAVQSYGGPWFVFDGHGSTNELGSTLVVGKDEVELWELRGKMSFPPIAIPLSCNMHPIDSSHSSAASALLGCGVRACFGSLLSIGGAESAVFAARLIRIVIELLPMMFGRGMPWVSWATLFGIVQQGQFVNEMSWFLQRKFNKRQAEIAAAAPKAIELTLRQDPEWYEECHRLFSTASGVTVAQLRRLISEELPVPDCLSYVHLGDPESIMITNPALVAAVRGKRSDSPKYEEVE